MLAVLPVFIPFVTPDILRIPVTFHLRKLTDGASHILARRILCPAKLLCWRFKENVGNCVVGFSPWDVQKTSV
jgi:hypothetical protein